MIYAFRMSSRVSEYTFLPRALDENAKYSIRQVFPQVESRDAYMSVKELMKQGSWHSWRFLKVRRYSS